MIFKLTYIPHVKPKGSFEFNEVVIASNIEEARAYGMAVIEEDKGMTEEFKSVDVKEIV